MIVHLSQKRHTSAPGEDRRWARRTGPGQGRNSARRGQAAPRVVTRITWSPQALRDVESIREYIAVDSLRHADLVVGRIVAAVERLHSFPE